MAEPTPRYGHLPIPMRRVEEEEGIKQRGDFTWTISKETGQRYIIVAIPDIPSLDGTVHHDTRCIPVKEGSNDPGKHWGWDGNEDKPTLTPSIHAIGVWHGWVRSGMLVEA